MALAFDVPGIRTHAIARSRLVDRLGGGDDRAYLTIVHGHAGSGKSTLLAQWARAQDWNAEALLWVTLHDDDKGALAFWSRIGNALVRNRLAEPDTTAALHRDGADGHLARTDAFRIVTASRPLTLVLDDYHVVSDDALDAQLSALVQSHVELRLVIGTRVVGSLGAVSLASRTRTTIVTADDLAFTRAESDALLDEHGFGGDEALSTRMFEVSEGWPLASQALIIERRRDSSVPILASTKRTRTHPQFVREFVTSTLAERADPEADFVRRISFADECTVELAARLTGDAHDVVRTRLNALEAEGIGTWQTRSGVRWFRIHPLLREGFEDEANATLDPNTVARVSGTLSDELRAARPLRSLELAMQIEDWDRVEAIALLQYGALTYYYRVPSGRLLASVPLEALPNRAALAGVYLATLYGIPTTSVDELRRVSLSLGLATREYMPAPGVLGVSQLTAISSSHRIIGEDAAALAFARRAVDALDALSQHDRAEAAGSLPTFYTQIATTYIVEGEYADALHLLESAWEVTSALGLTGERFHAAALTALTHALRGDITSASTWIEVCDSTGAYDGWFVGYLDSGYYIAQALIALNRWDGEAARAALVVPGTREHLIEFWPYLAIVEARARLWHTGALDAYAELSGTLARKRQRPKPPAPLLGLLAALRGELLILAGQTARAEKKLRSASTNTDPRARLVLARIASQRGEHVAALAANDRLVWESDDAPAVRVEALLGVASICLTQRDLTRAVEAFTAAVAAIKRYGVRLPLMSLPTEQLQELIALARAAGHAFDEELISGIPDVAPRTRNVAPLTKAEQRVLRALVQHEVDEAARGLHLSAHTVRYHLKRTYPKLGVNTREEAVRLAQELGLLE